MKAEIAAEQDLEPPTEEPLSAELVVDPKLEYQVGTRIYFGNDLYEVKGLPDRNHRSLKTSVLKTSPLIPEKSVEQMLMDKIKSL